MEPRRLTSQDIRKIVHSVGSLDAKQRGRVAEVLAKLAHSSDGKISIDELKRELRRLRDEYLISELDMKAVERAVFEG